jgi:hypothetical protein
MVDSMSLHLWSYVCPAQAFVFGLALAAGKACAGRSSIARIDDRCPLADLRSVAWSSAPPEGAHSRGVKRLATATPIGSR